MGDAEEIICIGVVLERCGLSRETRYEVVGVVLQGEGCEQDVVECVPVGRAEGPSLAGPSDRVEGWYVLC